MRKSFFNGKTFHTIRARIILCTVSLILVIGIIITCISYIIVSSNLRQNLIQTSETRLSFLCASIDANIESVKDFVHSCQTSSQIRKFAMDTEMGGQMKREARDFVMDAYNSNIALRSYLVRLVIIRNSYKDIIQVVKTTYSSIGVSADAILSLSCFEKLYANQGELCAGILQDPFLGAKNVPMLPFVATVEHPYQSGEIGVIFAEISTSAIIAPIQNYPSGSDGCLYFQIGDKFYQYTKQELLPCEEQFVLIKDISDMALSRDTIVWKMRREDGLDCIMITRPLENTGLYVSECLNEYVLSRNIRHTFSVVVIVILTATTCIGILFSWFLSKTVNVPVRQLQERMKRIAAGDFSRDASTEWEHELGDIGKTINDLSENVLRLLNQKIEDERQKKDYEYKMLQSQINPHFLYNTLNSIKWMATIQNAPGIAEMTTAFSRLLKDISKGTTSLISISHELSLIKDYFTIQKYRYGGIIGLCIDIEDESLTECEILKFTMQPIVENAIFHGIEPKGSAGTVTIHIYQEETVEKEDTDVHIDITDDGVGMDEESAAHLLDSDVSAKSSFFREIGVSNVHKRLQYEFGDSYGLRVTSKAGEFTTVSILLPYKKKEGAQDESFNSR